MSSLVRRLMTPPTILSVEYYRQWDTKHKDKKRVVSACWSGAPSVTSVPGDLLY